MNVLFKLNREKGRNSSVITAVSTAVTGVVGVAASSPSTTLSILSAAFGLTSALNDAYFNTYLFSEAPGLVAAKVLDLQTSYANTIDRSKIKTPADAYGAIQKYYQLCLPESIEGVLLQAIADTQAKTTPPPAGQKDTPHQRTMLVPRRGLQ